MRTVVMMILAGVIARPLSWAADRSLTACLPSHPQVDRKLQSVAQEYASRIYQSVGVDLRWKGNCREADIEAPATPFAPNLTAIGMAWAEHAPAGASPNALAAALPFQPSGVRITLYLERLRPLLSEPAKAAAVLGHVLAHEIGHVLLGHAGHARKGLMKAAWNVWEEAGMRFRPLQFSPDDAAIIRQNLLSPEQLVAALQD